MSEVIKAALIGAAGALLGTIITALANIAAAKIKAQPEPMPRRVPDRAADRPVQWSWLFIGALIGAAAALTIVYLLRGSSRNFVGYSFETGTEGWAASEQKDKLATTDVSTGIFHSGKQALRVVTELFGNGSSEYASYGKADVYRHTEAVVYFSAHIPEGLNEPGPYDLTSKRVSCFVFLPAGLNAVGSPNAYVRLMVKDQKYANEMSDAVDITDQNINQWIELSMVVSKDSTGADATFDPVHVGALGVRIDTLDGSTVAYSGPFYIDDCEISEPSP